MIKVFCRVDLLLTLLSIFPSPCANTELIPEKMLQPKTAPREIGGKFLLKSFVSEQKNTLLVKSFLLEFGSAEGSEYPTSNLHPQRLHFCSFLFVNWMKYWKLFMIKTRPLRWHTVKLMHRGKVPRLVFNGWKHFKRLQLLGERTVDSERWRTFINQRKIQRCRYWNQLKVFLKSNVLWLENSLKKSFFVILRSFLDIAFISSNAVVPRMFVQRCFVFSGSFVSF